MFKKTLRELHRYPSAIIGLCILAILVAMAVYAMVTIPYEDAVIKWRGGENMWYRLPKIASPVWTNWFRNEKLPETIVFSSIDHPESRIIQELPLGNQYDFNYRFDYQADAFPQDITIYFSPTYQESAPFGSVVLTTPDGRELRIYDGAIQNGQVFFTSQESKLERKYGELPHRAILSVPGSEPYQVLKGEYQIHITAFTFEEDADFDVEVIIYGQVYGIAGTDHLRRDLSVALLYGVPIALIFGLLAALGTTITTLFIAALGSWYGGLVDELIQRITEVNLVLPFLPIMIMIGTLYSRSIWVILGVTILLNIFGGSIKTYRANFLQIREAAYIEAAKAYGSSNFRIIFKYLLPRLIPLVIPQLVSLIPGYVFLEASLAVLGLGDPILPTWGKVIQNAYDNGAIYMGYYYWILEPAVLLMITGFAFAMLGFALDRIYNPKLREI